MVRLNRQEAEDLSVEVFGKVKNSLVLIRGSKGVGSGFVAKADGKVWLYTNEHVARCGHPLTASFIDGRKIPFSGAFEVAANRDVARMEVDASTCALPLFEEAPSIDLLVFVFGNSDGGGVLTKLFGPVLGVGDDKLEVDVKFVQGNSGSAIFNGKGEVLGIATEASLRRDPESWVKLDTRFNEVRRYGERLCDIDWESLEWDSYDRACRAYEVFEQFREFLIPVCFKNKKLVTDYRAKDVSEVKTVRPLERALSRLVKQDGEYIKALSELEDLLEKRKRYQPGAMLYPKDTAVNMRYKKLKRELLESIVVRKDALRTAMKTLKSYQWPCRRLQNDADALYEGFKYCADAYDEFNDDSLSQVDWHVN